MTLTDYSCQVCLNHTLKSVDAFQALPRVTSDCRPFKADGKLTVCMHCAAIQKICDQAWLDEIKNIYANYYAYEIAGGEEQLILDPVSGSPIKRSVVLTRQLQTNIGSITHNARVLDVGCGNGVTLQAMSDANPHWQLYGYELESNRKEQLNKIHGFNELFTGNLDAVTGKFDLITMVHSLEHFVQPLAALTTLAAKLTPNGYLFVEVCNVDKNPFDLLVADHLMHFTPATLAILSANAGLGCTLVATDWVQKEISFISSLSTPVNICAMDAKKTYQQVEDQIAWLMELHAKAIQYAEESVLFGIFGTSIGATWLASTLSGGVDFFVDEDPNRIGQTHMGKPIYSPQEVPDGACVFLALAPVLAKKIMSRLEPYSHRVLFLAVSN